MRILPLAVLSLVATAPAQQPPPKDLYDQGTLRTFNITFSPANWYQQLVTNRATGAELQGDMVVDGKLYQQIGVKIVGGDSFDGTTSDKKSLAISLDSFIPGQDLLGYDKLNLHNGFNDPTLMREVLGYEILRKYMPAPKANWVRVVINNVYWGLYVNVQQVDKTMIDPWFKGDDGNRYLAEPTAPAGRGNSALQWLGTTLQPYQDAYDLKNNNPTSPYVDLQALCNVLNNSAQLDVDLPKELDVDRAMWYLAHFNLIANLNGYNSRGNGYYLYRDEETDTFSFLPWDMAGAFGASSNQKVLDALNLDPFSGGTRLDRPLLGRTWGVPEWRARYVHHMRAILTDDFDWTKHVSGRVAAFKALIDAEVQADTKKLYSYQDFLDNQTKQVTLSNAPGFTKDAPGLQQFCDSRAAFLNGLNEFKAVAPTVSGAKATPDDPKPNTTTVITAKVTSTVAIGTVTAWFRGAGSWGSTQMFDDGQHGDGAANDGVYGGTVPASVHKPGEVIRFYVGAQSTVAAGGAVAYEPNGAANEPLSYVTRWAVGTSPIHLNELLAINTNTNRDPAGEFDDWVELYNTSANPVVVAGMYLTDDVANPTKWQFPTGTTIAGKGTLLVWCDEDGTQGPLHANFKLAGAGEEVILFDTDGKTRLSTIKYGQQVADVSIGWREDGIETNMVAFKKFSGGFGRGANPDVPNDPVIGAREFWPLDYTSHRLFVEWLGTSQIGNTNVIRVLNGTPSSPVLLYLSPATLFLPIGGGLNLMIGPTLVGPFPIAISGTGQGIVIINIPNNPALDRVRLYLQVGGSDTQGFTVSNAAQVTFFR